MDRPEHDKPATVAAFRAATEIEAEMVRLLLEAEGIPARIGEQVTMAYAPTLQVAGGYWGTVFVPSEARQRAQEILDAYAEGQGRVSEEELAEAAERAEHPGV
jgi:hypothetical protein